MAQEDDLPTLSKREQQIMDCIYQQGKATAKDVHQSIPDAPSYSAVRALLRILLDKGHLRYEKEGLRYVYSPTRTKKTAGVPALRRVVNTFFEGSMEKTVAALIKVSGKPLSKEQFDRLQGLINDAKKQTRKKS